MKLIIPFVSVFPGVLASDSNEFARLALLKAQHLKTKQQMAAKRQNIQSANALRNFKPSFILQDELVCDWMNEETCYDDNMNAVDCVPYADGGCPCPAGQEKCGAMLGYTGYCIEPEFCCEDGLELCYDKNWNPTKCMPISEGGCPCLEGQEKCGGIPERNITGYCTEFCCTDEEETCYDEYYDVVGCAAYSDGGCPCPEGENKCGGTDWWRSCSALCCEEDEETCYNENWTPSECKPIAEGGCDCPAGETKCYAEPEWNNPGWCVSVCCTDEQEACYDYDTGLHTCADIAAGGCPCPEGEEKCGAVEGVYAGHCIAPELCCNDNEELCYSDDWYPQPENCALISSGGCSCPEGETKCGAEPEMNYAGYCTSLCCEEQTCYDWNTYLPTSCAAWGEDCSTGISFDLLKGKSMNLIDQSTMKTQIAKLHNVKAMKAKMLANENAKHISVKKIVQAEEMAILRKTKRSIKQKSLENNVPIFMTKVY